MDAAQPMAPRYSVLFICTANQIRSPAAEALLLAALSSRAEELAHWQVGSAGTWTVDGQPAFPDILQILAARGIDLTTHRSRVIRPEIMDAYRLVLTMEPGHKEALQIVYPKRRSHIFLMSEMIGKNYAIPDPVSGPYSEFVVTVREIERVIDQGFEKLKQLAKE